MRQELRRASQNRITKRIQAKVVCSAIAQELTSQLSGLKP